MEGRIEVTGRRGRLLKQLTDDLKEKKWKAEALDRYLWRIRFGRSCTPAVREATGLTNPRGDAYSYYVTILLHVYVCMYVFSAINATHCRTATTKLDSTCNQHRRIKSWSECQLRQSSTNCRALLPPPPAETCAGLDSLPVTQRSHKLRHFCSLTPTRHYYVKTSHFDRFSTIDTYKILLNNQRDAALSSRIYSSLQGYSTCFECFLQPSSGVQLKLQMQS
jgi:hypothetical protein